MADAISLGAPSSQNGAVDPKAWMEWYRTQYDRLNQQASLMDTRSKQLDGREAMLYEREKKMWQWVDDLTSREQELGRQMKQHFRSRPPPPRDRDERHRDFRDRDRDDYSRRRYDNPRDPRDARDTRAPVAGYPAPAQTTSGQSWYDQSGGARYDAFYAQYQQHAQPSASSSVQPPVHPSREALVPGAANRDTSGEYRPESPAYNPTSPSYQTK